MKVIANLTTEKGKYIGLVEGILKKDIKDINNIRYKNINFTNFYNKGDINLEEIIEFSYDKKKRNIDKFVNYIFSLDINGSRFVNLNYNKIFSKKRLKGKSRKYSKISKIILGEKKSLFDIFKDRDKEDIRNEIMSNIIRLDDQEIFKYLNIGQLTIIGAIPIERQKEIKYSGKIKISNYYFIIKKDEYKLKCEIPNFKKRHNLIIPVIDGCIEKKKEIIVGGNYFYKDKRIVVHYLRIDNFRYPLFKGLFKYKIKKKCINYQK